MARFSRDVGRSGTPRGPRSKRRAAAYWMPRTRGAGRRYEERQLARPRPGKNSFVCEDGRISTLSVGSNYLEASATSSAQAIRGNCLLRVRGRSNSCPASTGDSVEFCSMSPRAKRLSGAKNRVRVKSNFVSRFKLIWVVSPPRTNISLSENQKLCTLPAVPLSLEGRLAIVTDVEAGCGGRGSVARRAILVRTAKACGLSAPTLALSRR
jgi:hypothetical protein